MIKDKLMLPKATKFILSPSFLSITISICLLVNLFIPRTGTVVNGKCDSASSRYHICGCQTEAHIIDLCCCKEETNSSEKSYLPNNSGEGLFTAFIQSLECAGIPDQYTEITYKISLPDGSFLFSGIFRFNYIEWLEKAIPTSITIPTPYKPPRLT